MQLLADSSDDSGSGLDMSDLDVGRNRSASYEGGDIPVLALSHHFCQQALACHLVVVVVDRWGQVPLPGPLGSIWSRHQLVEMLCSILNIPV